MTTPRLWTLHAALACLLAVTACTPGSRPDSQAASATEADLADFGRANPGCRLWTDWRRLCSRTGPAGAMRCNEDRARTVAPSRPFCVAARGVERLPYAANFGRSRQSSLRFCAVPIEEEGEALRTGEPELCEAYAPDRPFNGRRIAALRHPWCETWADATTGREICSERPEGADAAPSCTARATQDYEHERALICVRWKSDVPCRTPIGGVARPRQGGGVVVGGVPGGDARAAAGTFCLDE
jgi:hypothetical protein